MTGSGFKDGRERALLAGLNLLAATVVTVRKLVTPLTGEASKRNSSHPSIAVLNIRGVGNDMASSSVSVAGALAPLRPVVSFTCVGSFAKSSASD